MTQKIDLNADLGEDESPTGIARDIAIMDIVSSCNIATGGHAGSSESMRTMLMAAQTNAIAPGAHPSYPDRAGFGRQSLDIALADLATSLTEQLHAISAIAAEAGVSLTHIKPHGALYNDAQEDPELAGLLVEIAARYRLPLVGMDGSIVQQKAYARKIGFIAEAFIDRRYTDTGRLVPRSDEGAVIAEEEQRIRQGLDLASGKALTTQEGSSLTVHAQSLCLHSDSDGALETAKRMRIALEQAGIVIGPVRS
ncbi:5-oxoprolinase subunit PxpA [uncultured Parasphingorhabdus sp.]|uniref:5-oxoprolinase subunit PxpA n=1 Tax=uncultured Parasphingorhabdus sp. TaxID=2709694 RepID=UPI002AA93B26|nr:5-oxoprolinase subunit PxpA [uncultured Parasphingorhabdus sp.]